LNSTVIVSVPISKQTVLFHQRVDLDIANPAFRVRTGDSAFSRARRTRSMPGAKGFY